MSDKRFKKTDHTTYPSLDYYYIAGPMSGIEDYNHPKFNTMAALLYALGFRNVLNPTRIAEGNTTYNYSFYIRESLKMIAQANAVVFLDGWEKSRGAQLEYHCAKLMGLDLYDERGDILKEPCAEDTRSICEIADELVSSDRRSTYGHPYDNFTDIGVIWGLIISRVKLNPDGSIPPETVGLMMVGLKMAREMFLHKKDNLIDGAGYFKTIDLIHERKKEIADEATAQFDNDINDMYKEIYGDEQEKRG